METVLNLMADFDWKLLFSAIALLVSLISLRRSNKYKEEERLLKKRELNVQIAEMLDEAWNLMTGEPGLDVSDSKSSKLSLVEASRIISKAKILSPNNPDIYSFQGMYFKHRGQLLKAEASFLRAIELDPNSSEWYVNLYVVYKDMANDSSDVEEIERFEKQAIEYLLEAYEIDPRSVSVNGKIATNFYNQNDFESALEYALKIVKDEPDHVEGWKFVELTYHRLGKIKDAKDAKEKYKVLEKLEAED